MKRHDLIVKLSAMINDELRLTCSTAEFQAVARLGHRIAKMHKCDTEIFRRASGFDVTENGVYYDVGVLPKAEAK